MTFPLILQSQRAHAYSHTSTKCLQEEFHPWGKTTWDLFFSLPF